MNSPEVSQSTGSVVNDNPDHGEMTMYPDHGEATMYPDHGEATMYPDHGEATMYPDHGEATMYPGLDLPNHYTGSNLVHVFDHINDPQASSPDDTESKFTEKSLLTNLFSIILFFVDYASDIWVIVALHGEEGWSAHTISTILLVFIPLCIVNITSAIWYHQDHQGPREGFCPVSSKFQKWETLVLTVGHVALIGPVMRLLHVIWCGRRETGPRAQAYRKLRLYYERDGAYLSLIDSCLQDAPQLLLQSFILLTREKNFSNTWTSLIQVGSVFLSLSSMSLGVVSHVSACHSADQNLFPLSTSASCIHWLWRMFVLSSRMMCFALFLTVYKYGFLIFVGVHVCGMFVWIRYTGSNFCGSSGNKNRPIEEFLYDVLVAFIYLYDKINISPGNTRWRNTLYYVISWIESTILLVMWDYGLHNTESGLPAWSYTSNFQVTMICLIQIFFFLGIIFIYIYYKRFHRTKKKKRHAKQNSFADHVTK